MNDANNEERLQKVLARAGIASRRACEELITAGRVRVNGKVVTQLGVKINPAQDKILVDEHPVAVKPGTTPKKIYLMLNKPAGYLSTVSDPQGRPTIMDLVEIEERLYPVGRLDAETEGLLLLTNDGSFAQSLSHPRFGVEKEYLAVLDGRPPLKELERLRKGIKIPVENPETGELEEQVTQPAKVDLVGYEGSNSLIRFVIKEGKKRQVRLMARAIGFSTLNLKRVRFGPLPLADLDEGKTRPLSKAEIKSLLQAANGERVTIQNKPNSRSANKGDPTTAGKKRPNEEHLRPDFKERQNAGKRPDNNQFQPFRRPVSDERPHFDRRTPSLSDRRPANDERQPFRRPSNDDRRLPNEERPIFQRPVSNERPHFDRKPNNEPPFRRPVADERPPFRRPVNDRPINDNRISNNNEQPFRRPATDERPPFRRPATDERPPFRRPVTDERPPFRRPVTDERPPFRRPIADERPPFRRPIADERPPFRRPIADERPPFRRPVADERPPFRRPVSDERPNFSRPAADERPPFRRPVSDEQPPFRRPVRDERPNQNFGKRPPNDERTNQNFGRKPPSDERDSGKRSAPVESYKKKESGGKRENKAKPKSGSQRPKRYGTGQKPEPPRQGKRSAPAGFKKKPK